MRWRGAGSGVRTGGHLRGAGTGGHLRGAASWGRSGELDRTSRGSGELDGTSRGSGELDGTSMGSGELGGTSMGTGGRSRGAGTGELWRGLRIIGLAIFSAGRQGRAAGRIGGLGGAADDGRLVLARARTLSRHRRIPSLHFSPVVSGRSTGRWALAPCQNRDRMVASSNAVAAASPQNSREYAGKGRSRWARAMKRAVTSIAAGARKPGGNKKLFKNGKTKTREEKRRFLRY